MNKISKGEKMSEIDVSGGFDLTQEHQVPVMNWMLDELEAVLALFPEGFLAESLSEGSIQKAVISRCHQKDTHSQGDGPAQDIGSMPFQFIFQNDHT